jgi:phosphate uptake regulator
VLIALRQPVAVDLRMIVSVLTINADLGQVGDLSVDVCRAAHRYLGYRPVEALVDLPRTGDR